MPLPMVVNSLGASIALNEKFAQRATESKQVELIYNRKLHIWLGSHG